MSGSLLQLAQIAQQVQPTSATNKCNQQVQQEKHIPDCRKPGHQQRSSTGTEFLGDGGTTPYSDTVEFFT